MRNYTLNGTVAVVEPDVLNFARWFEKADRSVAQTDFPDGSKLSTVFLGIDHGWGDVPVLFETMIFGGPHHEKQWRYSTWEEAKENHEKIVAQYPELED